MKLLLCVLQRHAAGLLVYLGQLALIGVQACVVWFLWQGGETLLALAAAIVVVVLVRQALRQNNRLVPAIQITEAGWARRECRRLQEERERASYE